MALVIDKIFAYIPTILVLFIFLATLIVEVFGCKLNELFSGDLSSLITPGIKVIG